MPSLELLTTENVISATAGFELSMGRSSATRVEIEPLVTVYCRSSYFKSARLRLRDRQFDRRCGGTGALLSYDSHSNRDLRRQLSTSRILLQPPTKNTPQSITKTKL